MSLSRENTSQTLSREGSFHELSNKALSREGSFHELLEQVLSREGSLHDLSGKVLSRKGSLNDLSNKALSREGSFHESGNQAQLSREGSFHDLANSQTQGQSPSHTVKFSETAQVLHYDDSQHSSDDVVYEEDVVTYESVRQNVEEGLNDVNQLVQESVIDKFAQDTFTQELTQVNRLTVLFSW